MEEDKVIGINDEIFAKALARILDNQIQIKKHFGMVKDESYYGDCYYDNKIMDDLCNIN